MKEVILVEKHPKGGHVVTIQETVHDWRTKTNSLKQTVYLRLDWADWYLWPSCKKDSDWTDLESAWKSHQVRLSHNPPAELQIRASGNPHRCMFCHDGMSGLAAYCLKCSGAMHLACVGEAGDACQTPGCEDEDTKRDAAARKRDKA